MGKGTRVEQSTDDRLLLLREEQTKFHEGSFEWADIQAKIDQIVSERYLEYVNR